MSTKRPAPVSRSIELIFFVSGLTGIVFQVIAFKVLGLVMGNSVHSVTAVVTSFMAGLAAGSYLAARLTPEQTPVRTYALLEAGIAGYILMFPALVDAAQPLLGQAYLTYGDHYQMLMLVRFAISGILLMIPTVLMGATLPVLTHALSSSASQTGSVAGRLYAINSLGAVFGAVLASFFILPNLGISTTLRILALTNLMIAWFALRSSGPALEPTTHSVAGKKRRGAKGFESVDRRVMALILGLSGFAAMGFEIAWTRALVLVVGTSTYAFSIILATFIGGISAGSAFATRYLVEEDEDLRPVIVWLLVGTATLGVLSLPLIGYLPLVQIDILLNFNANWWLLEVTQFLLVGVVTFLPAAFMGAGFPVALSLVTKGNQDTLGSASAVGTLYGSNTTGNILGSFATGALLIPMMGLQLTVLTISLIEGLAALVASAVLLPQGKRLVPSLAAIGIPLALYMILPSWNTRLLNSGPYVYAGIYSRDARLYKSDYFDAIQKNGEIIFHEEGVSATVAVIETPGGHRGLSINGKTDASSYQDMKTQRVVGHFPLLVHPDPKNALVIGLGSGVTLASVLKHRVQDVHLIEISPEVINSAAYFRQVNYGCLEDPRVRATVGDGRNHILHTQETYDVIVSEPTNPWIAGVGNLFSKEYFESCKKRLRPGGVMTAWVQAYSQSADDFKSVIKTFDSVFDNVTLWRSTRGLDYILIGRDRPLDIDLDRIRNTLADRRFSQDMIEVGIEDEEDFLAHFVASSPVLGQAVADATMITDDNLQLEFSAPRNLYASGNPANAICESFNQGFDPILVRAIPDEKLRGERIARLNARVHAHQAVGLIKAGKLKEGLQEVEVARRLGIDEEGLGKVMQIAYSTLALTMKADNHPEEAIAVLEKVLKMDETTEVARADLHNELGNLYSFQNKSEEAVNHYRAALKIDPRSPAALKNLGLSLAKMGDIDEAISLYEQVAAESPYDSRALNNLGILYEKLGRLEEASEAYRKAMAVDPANHKSEANLLALDITRSGFKMTMVEDQKSPG